MQTLKTVHLSSLDYIPAKTVSSFKKQGIENVYDLLTHYPNRYEDFTVIRLEDAKTDENVTIEGTVLGKVIVNNIKPKLVSMSFYVEVEEKKIKAIIFNRQFLKTKLTYGTLVRLNGKFNSNYNTFTINEILFTDEGVLSIYPVYDIKDITASKYIKIMEKTIDKYLDQVEEELPGELIHQHQLRGLKDTICTLNFPDKITDLNKAIERVKYEELLRYQIDVKYLSHRRKSDESGVSIEFNGEKVAEFIEQLPYQLTPDQYKVLEEILTDMASPYKMNRLLQGEVGSGKTIVSAISIYAAITANYQGALMCPTEILASQHYLTFLDLFRNLDCKIALLTSSIVGKERKILLENLASGEIDILIGTHALFQKEVEFKNLGIVVTDEEHRFGVKQRVSIKTKGLDIDYLKMSATPIPRTLAISSFGDTDISIIKTMPGQKKQVITKYVDEKHKKAVMDHIKKELKDGRQIFIVTPLINESEAVEAANATEIFQNMKHYFDGVATVGLIHGKLKMEEKEQVMASFLKNEIQILVATSVIEGGVNVLNATSIVILGAERFGIAQLHQMRGRVQRGDLQSYCFLVSDASNESSIKRLKLVEENSDGFVLAEEDLKIRGPGDFFGERQSGNVSFRFADIVADELLFEKANDDAGRIVVDPEFNEEGSYRFLFQEAYDNFIKKTSQLD
jgi:ATP-dependent DNA helicase RecG